MRQEQEKQQLGIVLKGGTRIWNGPGHEYKQVGKLEQGAKIEVYDKYVEHAGRAWHRIGHSLWINGGFSDTGLTWQELAIQDEELKALEEEEEQVKRGVKMRVVSRMIDRDIPVHEGPGFDFSGKGSLAPGEIVWTQSGQHDGSIGLWYCIGNDRWVHGKWLAVVVDGDTSEET